MPRRLPRVAQVPSAVVHWSRRTLQRARISRKFTTELYLDDKEGPTRSYARAMLRERTERTPFLHKADRLSLLQKLWIPPLNTSLQPRTAHCLAAALYRARQLRHIVLSQPDAGDNILFETPALGVAICYLRTLKSLDLRSPSAALLGLLPILQSSPTHVSIMHTYWDGEGGVQPLPALSSLKKSLRSFELYGVQASAPPLEPGEPLPDVSRLVLASSSIPHIAPFISTFPRPRHVMMHDITEENFKLPDDQDTARHYNLQAQEVARWPALDLLSGGLRSLYVHAVQSPARTLSVRDCTTDDREISMLATLLSDARPERLHVEVWPKLSKPEHLPRALEASPPLSHLTLALYVNYNDSDDIVRDTLESVVELAARHPLASLDVRLCREDHHKHSPDDPNPNARFVAALDSTALAQRLVQAVPTLRRLFLSIPNHRRSRAWQVLGEGADRAPRELGFRAMKAAARQEGVVVYENYIGHGFIFPLPGSLKYPW
ncbi:hypothetical protein OF83DRAFT_1174657 [Amylostereum chailletii]|nr:hypothetical protein OF83DRAFT_1174657 [Amylostereum chailletii]